MQTLTKAALLFITGLFALFLLISPVYSAEDDVSKPAGYMRIEVGSNSSVLVAMPFEPFEGTLGGVFSNQLKGAATEEAADRVMQWDNQCQCYRISFKADNTGDSGKDGRWFESGTNWVGSTQSLNRGSAFWVENRHEAQAIVLGGSLAVEGTQTMSLLQGLNVFGYPYAARKDLNESGLTESGAYGSTNEGSADQVITALGVTNWLMETEWVTGTGAVSETIFGLSDGYWYRRQPSETLEWLIERPYEDLFGGGSNAPSITAIIVDTNQTTITLQIACLGASGETLEIYAKDLGEEDSFESGSGWTIAEEGIETTGRTTVTWTEGLTGAFCRVYLVGRGDLDTDADGLSDASERFVFQTMENDGDTDNDGLSDGAEVETYQTDPLDADTDGDGMSDGTEVWWGNDPTVGDGYASLPWAEDFEARTVGELDGQNGWTAAPGNTALVQSNMVEEGEQALQLVDSAEGSSVHHVFGAAEITNVWVDFQTKLVPGALPDVESLTNRSTAVLAVDTEGKVCGYDGYSNDWKKAGGNFQSLENWVRVTIKLDYGLREWRLNIDGALVFGELGFKDEMAGEFSRAQWNGSMIGESYLDDIKITTSEPEDLDDDGDGLPNVWERQYGAENPGDDLDGDGLTNLEEYQLQTNPAEPDSDGDGIDDGVEHDWGNDPAQSNAYASIPWSAGFETNEGYEVGSVSGVNGWSVSEGAGEVQTAAVYTGEQALKVEDGAVTRYGLSEPGAVVWTKVNAQMVPGPLPEMEGTKYVAAAVALNSDRRLAGYDGTSGQWVVATNTADVELFQWAELAVKKDYGEGKWSLYRNGQPVLKGLGFADGSLTRMVRVAVEGVGVVDDLTVGTQPPGDLDSDYDGLMDWQEDANTNGVVDEGETDPEQADSDGDGMDDGAEAEWGFSSTTSNQFTGLPWVTGFENEEGYTNGVLNGQPGEVGWEATESVEVQYLAAYEGTNAAEIKAELEGDSLARYYLAAEGEPEVWVDGHARLLPGVLPDGEALSAGNAVMLAVDLNGQLCAYDSREKAWQVSDVEYQTEPDEWVRVTIHADYAKKVCCVYMDGVRVFRDLPFADESNRWLSRFATVIPSGTGRDRSTYLDSIGVTTMEPEELDNDGDGMANTWEEENGLSSEDATDAHLDGDADGLTNLEEFQYGSNPWVADTDEDGVLDDVEYTLLCTGSSTNDITGIETVATIYGSEGVGKTGSWVVDGSGIYSERRRGEVEFTVNSPTGEMYLLEVDVTQQDMAAAAWNNYFFLMIYVDGEFVSRRSCFAPYGSTETLQILTPWLASGTHTVGIFWDNTYYSTALRINELRIRSLLGPDGNENGVKDWVECALPKQCSVDFVPETSAVSPLCIEGAERYVSKIAINEVGQAYPGLEGRWYANVELAEEGTTTVVVAFQDGAYAVTNEVRWVPTNLLSCENPVIRKGDSLLLSAHPEGVTNGIALVEIEGLESFVVDPTEPVAFCFDESGSFEVEVTYFGNGTFTSRVLQVEAVDPAIPEEWPVCWRYRTREWDWSGLSTQAVVESDEALEATETGALEEGGRRFELKLTDTEKDHYLVSRLGAGGPVLASVKADGFWLKEGYNGYILLVGWAEEYPILQQCMATWKLPETATVEVSIFTSGVLMYPEMELTKTLTTEDLDDIGDCAYQFIVIANYVACHNVHVYQGTNSVGSLYFSEGSAYDQ